MQPDRKLGPWTLGIDNVSAATAIPPHALADAVNVDIDRAGRVARRAGRTLVLAKAGAHSLRATSQGALFAASGVLYRLDGGAGVELATLASDDPCDYAELDDGVLVSSRTTLLRVRNGVAQALGLPRAAPPLVAPSDSGGLAAGNYGIAAAFQRTGGEEGPLSTMATVTVPDGGGISLTGLPYSDEAATVRIYRTPCDGDALYHCDDVPIGTPTRIGHAVLGKPPTFPLAARMLPGEHVTTWRGRLLTAQGRAITWSQPLAYGVTSLRHNFLIAPHRVTLLAAVEGGVFVGTTRGMWLLRGTGPHDAEWLALGALAPIAHTCRSLPGDALDPQLGLAGQTVLVWLAPNGFALGTQDGRTLAVQMSRIQGLTARSGALAFYDRRVTAIVH